MIKKGKSKIFIGICILLLVMLAMPVLSGCGQQADLTIGLTQFATHPAADAGRLGFMEALSDNGYVQPGEQCPEGMERIDVDFDYQNPEGDPTTEQTIAQKFVNDKVDMIFSFGTRISQQCVNAAEGTDIPVVFCAITDPVAAELVTDWHHPGEYVTGTSDMIEVDSNVELIQSIVPGLSTLGTLYNSGESNSIVLNDQLKEVCSNMGIELIEVTVSTSAEVQTAAQSLVGKVDAIWIGTDNTVVSGLEALIKVCEDNQIPFFPSDDPSIEKGGIATLGFDYYDVGYQTGLMAVKILNGTPADEVDVELGNIFTYTVNTKAAKIYGVTIPQAILDKAATVYTEVRH
ncbi:ABC transporter substrate-binding protein [Chloroflexota bacterium]